MTTVTSCQEIDALYLEKNTPEVKKTRRLVAWMHDVFSNSLKEVVARRMSRDETTYGKDVPDRGSNIGKKSEGHVIDEVVEIIQLPYDSSPHVVQNGRNEIMLEEKVLNQLKKYIHRIASLYQDNPCTFTRPKPWAFLTCVWS